MNLTKTLLIRPKKLAKDHNKEITISSDLKVALDNVDVVYTDVWVSMGDEKEAEQRQKILHLIKLIQI